MKNKTIYILNIIICIIIHIQINAQDAITADVWDATTDPGQCEDGIIDLHINGGFPPYHVHWTGPGGFDVEVFGITGNDDGEDLSNLVDGTYTVTVTDVLCGTAELSVDVGCEDCPYLILGIAHYGFIECEGKKGKLTVDLTNDGYPPYEIKWSNGENTETIENLDPGYYTVTVTDARGCETSHGLNLYVINPAIVLTKGKDLTVVDNCKSSPPNGSVTFVNPLGVGYSYSWTSSNGFTSNSQDISGLQQGIYCVKVRKLSNPDCIYAKGCVGVALNLGPTIVLEDITNLSFCKGKEEQWKCDGSLTISVPTGAYIEWRNIPNLNETFSSTLTDLCATSYTVEVCLDGCCSTQTFTMECCLTFDGDGSNQESVDRILVSGETNSNKGQIILTVTGGGSTIYYSWTGPDGFTSNSKNLYGLEPGIYCVRVFDGCSEDNECFEIVDCDLVTINISGSVMNTCAGYSYGSISLSVSGGNSPYKYKWSNGPSSSSINDLSEGQYCVTVTDNSGCVNEKCFKVGTKAQDVTGVTNPCGWQYSCNGNNTQFVSYDGNMDCFYNDPFDCTRVNCYCPVTGGYVGGWNDPYVSLDYDWNQCILWGLCPDGSGWTIAQYGNFDSWYEYVEVCPNCFQCYFIKICILNGYYQVIEAYPVGDSNCGGPGLQGDDEPLSYSSPLRLNELNYILKRDGLVDVNSKLLIPEGISNTSFIEEYTAQFEQLMLENEKIRVYELKIEDEITEISCSDKVCEKGKGKASTSRSTKTVEVTDSDMAIYPNPFTDEINVIINNMDEGSTYSVVVYSVTGQVMFKEILNSESSTIQSKSWIDGIYICIIKEDGRIVDTQRMIKR